MVVVVVVVVVEEEEEEEEGDSLILVVAVVNFPQVENSLGAAALPLRKIIHDPSHPQAISLLCHGLQMRDLYQIRSYASHSMFSSGNAAEAKPRALSKRKAAVVYFYGTIETDQGYMLKSVINRATAKGALMALQRQLTLVPLT